MRSLVLTVFFALLPAALASAQEPLAVATSISPEGALSYETLLRTAIERSPAVLGARSEGDAARARIDGARVLPSPHLRGGIATVDISGAAAPTLTSIELMMPVEYSGRIDARVARADVLSSAHGELVSMVELSIGAEAAARYASAIEAALVLSTHRALLTRAETIVALVERRIELGEGSALDAAAARLELARLRGDVASSEGEVGAASIALAELLTSFETEPLAAGSLRFPEPTADLGSEIEAALASRPDLRALRLAVEAAERGRDEQHRSRAPDLAIYVGWQHSFDSLGSLFNQPEYDALFFGLDVEIPIRLAWDGELREADAELAAREAEVATLELTVRQQIHSAARAHAAAHARSAILEEALADVQLAARLVTRALELGEERILGVLAAERAVGEAIEAYQRALGEEAQRYLALLRALGRRIEHWPGR